MSVFGSGNPISAGMRDYSILDARHDRDPFVASLTKAVLKSEVFCFSGRNEQGIRRGLRRYLRRYSWCCVVVVGVRSPKAAMVCQAGVILEELIMLKM